MAQNKKEKLEISHTIHGGIIDGVDGDIGGSRHELQICYENKVANILFDVGGHPGNTTKTNSNKHTISETKTTKDTETPLFTHTDAVLLSHVHYDHGGELVHLPKNGFKKHVFLPDISKKLEEILMFDALEKQDKLIRTTNEGLKKNREQLKKANSDLEVQIGTKKTRNIKSRQKSNLSYEEIETIFRKNGIEKITPLSKEQLTSLAPNYLERTFSGSDVKDVLKKMKPMEYKVDFPIIKNFVSGKFYNAGHINGSGLSLVKVLLDNHERRKNKDKHKENTFNILYTGDIGRFKDPGKAGQPDIPKEKIDYLVIEGTYGDRLHPSRTAEKNRFLDEINSAEGLVLIPCFTIERFQEIRELLGEAIANKQIDLKNDEIIYFDSKTAYNISKEYLINDKNDVYKHLKANPHMERVQSEENGNAPLSPKDILQRKGRVIVVCSGGMGEMGTIAEYLVAATRRKDAKILPTGFQAPGTIGYKLAHNIFSEPIVINGTEITENKAQIKSFSFSSHGDQDDLMRFIKSCNLAENVKISIVHGGEQRYPLASKIEEYLIQMDMRRRKDKRGKWEVIVPEKNGDTVIVSQKDNDQKDN